MGVDYSKRLERAKYHFLQTNENKRKITEFIDHLIANNISPVRQLKYFYTLKTIYKNFNKTFTQANKKDIEEFIGWINNSTYEYWTKRDFKIIIKKFYKWLKEEEGQNYNKYEYPNEVKWINTGKKQNKKKLPIEMMKYFFQISLFSFYSSNINLLYYTIFYKSFC